MAAANRIRQGLRALTAFTRPVEYALAARYLTPAEMTLFRAMSRGEQLHSLNVLRDVLKQDVHTPRELAVAALLHDCGKARYKMSVSQKTLVVLVRKLLPGRYIRWSHHNQLSGWQAPFVVAEQHPIWSADMLADADADDSAIWLARQHQDDAENWREHPHYPLLQRLQEADDLN